MTTTPGGPDGPVGPGQAPPATGWVPEHPRATLALVLGILSVVTCQLLGPFAWVIGQRAVHEIDASGGRVGGRGAAQAGYVLGVVGTVMLGLGLLSLLVLGLLFMTGAVVGLRNG
jgi:hypothetical protein